MKLDKLQTWVDRWRFLGGLDEHSDGRSGGGTGARKDRMGWEGRWFVGSDPDPDPGGGSSQFWPVFAVE